jgi:hypothetical protein
MKPARRHDVSPHRIEPRFMAQYQAPDELLIYLIRQTIEGSA